MPFALLLSVPFLEARRILGRSGRSYVNGIECSLTFMSEALRGLNVTAVEISGMYLRAGTGIGAAATRSAATYVCNLRPRALIWKIIRVHGRLSTMGGAWKRMSEFY